MSKNLESNEETMIERFGLERNGAKITKDLALLSFKVAQKQKKKKVEENMFDNLEVEENTVEVDVDVAFIFFYPELHLVRLFPDDKVEGELLEEFERKELKRSFSISRDEHSFYAFGGQG